MQSCIQVIETVFIIIYICSLTGFKQEEEGTTEDEMVGWHLRLNGDAIQPSHPLPGNRGPTECGTTHEATSGMSS